MNYVVIALSAINGGRLVMYRLHTEQAAQEVVDFVISTGGEARYVYDPVTSGPWKGRQ